MARSEENMRKDFGSRPWFYPLPVLIIATYNEDGTADAMNAAWGGLYNSDKVIHCLSSNHRTTRNIKERGDFTISFADAEHTVNADYVGLVSMDHDNEKMKKSGFNTEKSKHVDAPLIRELPVALECTYEDETDNGNIIGRIVNISIDEHVLTDERLDLSLFHPISFDPVNNEYRTMGEKTGSAFSSGNKLK